MEVVEDFSIKSKKTHLVIFAVYFLAAFFILLMGIKIIQNMNTVYAQESATASQNLSIPAIGLDTPVTTVEYTGTELSVPHKIAGAYTAHDNKTLLFGHSSTVFNELKNLRINDEISYNGKKYEIVSIENKEKSSISMKEILKEETTDTIVLMTCSGEPIPNTDADYTHRLIITAVTSQRK